MKNFKAHTKEQNRQSLASELPNGKAWATKNIKGTNLFGLLEAIGGEITKIDELFEDNYKQFSILYTDNLDYIRLWESMVGIPDDVFTQTESLSIEERRDQVLLKLRGLGTLTEQDFIDLAKLLGIDITIEHGADNLYPPYSVPFCPLSEKGAKFVMFVIGAGIFSGDYPAYNVPFLPTADDSQIVNLFEKLKPAMTKILFINN